MNRKRVCFGIKLYKLTSSDGITLNYSVTSRKRVFHNGNENSDMSTPEKNSFIPIETITQTQN